MVNRPRARAAFRGSTRVPKEDRLEIISAAICRGRSLARGSDLGAILSAWSPAGCRLEVWGKAWLANERLRKAGTLHLAGIKVSA